MSFTCYSRLSNTTGLGHQVKAKSRGRMKEVDEIPQMKTNSHSYFFMLITFLNIV